MEHTMKIKLPTLTCLRCGHRWHPKREELPKCCGFCKSPYWNTEPEDRSKAKERHTVECEPCRNGDV
jgi:ribosomal protein L37E